MEWQRPGEQPRKRILILGGGFAGVYTAYQLQKACKGQHVEIAIVNRENFFVFYPLLPEIVSGTIETESVLNPIRLVASKATLYVGEVEEIHLDRQEAVIRHGLYRHQQRQRTLFYDHLVIALGGIPNTSVVPGLAEYSFDVQRLSSAFALRNHLIDILEQADIEDDPVAKQRLLTFVVVGGGATGVEVAAEIRDLVHHAAKHYERIEEDDLRVVIVHSGSRLFPDLPKRLARYAERILRKRDVEVLFERRAIEVTSDLVRLDDGTEIPTKTVVGSVGVQPNPLVRDLPVPHDERGRVQVLGTLRVHGYDNVWALGDNAMVRDPHTGQPYPQTAQHAVRAAKLVARNIAASLTGQPLKPMRYKTIGQMVALGHRSAIAYIRGVSFSGYFAWWMWRTYYLSQVPRWEKRLRIVFDWTIDLLFPPELVQLKVGQPAPMAPSPEKSRKREREKVLG